MSMNFGSVSHDVNTSDMAWGEADLLWLPLIGFRFMCAMGVVVTPPAGWVRGLSKVIYLQNGGVSDAVRTI